VWWPVVVGVISAAATGTGTVDRVRQECQAAVVRDAPTSRGGEAPSSLADEPVQGMRADCWGSPWECARASDHSLSNCYSW
jgi:hypothetical protein